MIQNFNVKRDQFSNFYDGMQKATHVHQIPVSLAFPAREDQMDQFVELVQLGSLEMDSIVNQELHVLIAHVPQVRN